MSSTWGKIRGAELQALSFYSKSVSGLTGYRSSNKLSILLYHRVLPAPDPLRAMEPDVETFDRQMELLSHCFNLLSLSEALKMLEAGNLPKRAACVTFDDGYADNVTCALPILKKWNIPATVFVSSGYLNGGIMWNDIVIESIRGLTGRNVKLDSVDIAPFAIDSVASQVYAIQEVLTAIKHLSQAERQNAVEEIGMMADVLPDDLMMTDGQLVYLRDAGIEIGGHTRTHPILTTLDGESAREEIAGGKVELERILQHPVRFFAYPNGKAGTDFTPEHCNLAKEAGFTHAFTTDWGVADVDTNNYRLPRFTPWDTSRFGFVSRMWMNTLGIL